jgi:formylglycine-generating enzyme required for sulfatase activity
MFEDRDALIATYRRIRARTHEIFGYFPPESYYERPISLRNPVVFYEGHLPGFALNTLVKLALKQEGIDARLETLFARGIDPADEASVTNAASLWPSREETQAFAAACDARIEEALRNAVLVDERVPQLRGGEAVFTILEHELMHQETLLYMLHEVRQLSARSSQLADVGISPRAASRELRAVTIPAGRATLGKPRGSSFGWDNEFPELVVDVPAFTIDIHNITNGQYLDYVNATGAPAPHFWTRAEDGTWLRRGMFELTPLPLDAPVYVTHDEAAAYAQWNGKRLPTEAEFHRAAYGTPSGAERQVTEGNFDFVHWDPVAVGSYPPSAFGVHDLVGNGWEWTSSLFAGFPGFEIMPSYPEYSADFFDNAHYVLKGASPVTARELVRRSFRNWFRPNYPYVFATFRCVS